MVGARFNRPGHATLFVKEFMIPTTFDVAFKQYKKFFKIKTGLEWDHRLDGLKPGEDAFVYVPPPKGEPRGVMPMGWKEPPQNSNNGSDNESS
jgi:hypothetical protein